MAAVAGGDVTARDESRCRDAAPGHAGPPPSPLRGQRRRGQRRAVSGTHGTRSPPFSASFCRGPPAEPPEPGGRDGGSGRAAALLPLRAAVRGLRGAPRGAAPGHAAPGPPPPAPGRPPGPAHLPQLPAALPPHLQLRALPGAPGPPRGAHLQVLPGQPRPCLPVQLRGERGVRPG